MLGLPESTSTQKKMHRERKDHAVSGLVARFCLGVAAKCLQCPGLDISLQGTEFWGEGPRLSLEMPFRPYRSLSSWQILHSMNELRSEDAPSLQAGSPKLP